MGILFPRNEARGVWHCLLHQNEPQKLLISMSLEAEQGREIRRDDKKVLKRRSDSLSIPSLPIPREKKEGLLVRFLPVPPQAAACRALSSQGSGVPVAV